VHDFAVFLDKDFYVRKSNFSLPSGKNITAYSFFERDRGSSKMWLKANDYLRDAVLHYSEMLGEYPYDYVSAVENKASNGSGMEYPMITLIGQEATDFDLDLVITHEVGHNWFYGILASNEREHAWMDEGFNSFYESLYVLKKYPEKKLSGRYASFAKSLNFRHERYELSHYLRTLLLDRSNDKIGMCTSVSALPRADFYYILHYEKPASLLFYLRDYLGNEIFDKAMKAYYEKWKFKHPSPDDLREVLESVSQKKLDWLFNDLIKENKKAEFGITDCRKEGDFFSFTVIMNGTASAPVPVSFLSENDEVLKKVWIEPFKVRKEVKEEVKGAQKAVLDFDEVSLDIDRSNHECTSH
jgi:aminopeptidase N